MAPRESVVMTASERIEEKYGVKWERAGDRMLLPPPSIPTGSILLNEAIGECKGYPEGAIIEVFGPQHSGKTLMGYLAISACQKANPKKDNLILDAENQFKFQARWAAQVGVNVPDLFVTGVSSAEEAFDKMEMAILGKVEMDKDGVVKKVIEPGNFGIILVDSVAQLVPLEMVHKSMEESKRMAALASVMSAGLKKVVSAMSLTKSKTIIIFINQTRLNPSIMFGNKETRTGGTALPFYDTIALRVAKVKDSEERDAKGKIFAHKVKIKFEKNKAGQLPAEPIIFRLRYDGTGIDNDHEMWGVAEQNGLLMKVKKKYVFVDPGTTNVLDDTIDPFTEEDFGETLKQYPKYKDMIMEFIKKGSFYGQDVAEDTPDVAEDGVHEKVEVKQEVKPAEVAVTEIKESTAEKFGKEVPPVVETTESSSDPVVEPPKILQGKRGRPPKAKEEVPTEVPTEIFNPDSEQESDEKIPDTTTASTTSEPPRAMIQRKRGRPPKITAAE